jgi:hypothetical protein
MEVDGHLDRTFELPPSSGSGEGFASAPAGCLPAVLSDPVGCTNTSLLGTPHSCTTCSTASSAARRVSNSAMKVLSMTAPFGAWPPTTDRISDGSYGGDLATPEHKAA